VRIREPPRPRAQWMLRDIFLVARPPLLAVMQGGEFAHSNPFTLVGQLETQLV
jgi:hypothetical protein